MKRKLALLNVALAVLLVAVGWQLRTRWLQARAREAAVLGKSIQPAPVPPTPPAPVVEPVRPDAYIDVAQNMLFSSDRNPAVVVEPVAPKPMPALPVAHGVLDLGSGPTAILTEKQGAPQRGYRAGEQIGDFILVAVTAQELVFEWEGQQVARRVEELAPRKTDEASAVATAAVPSAPPAAAAPVTVLSGSSSSASSQAGPGVELGGQSRGCQAGDNSPPGTIVGGYKKVVTESPFGKGCRWEPVK